MSKSNGLPLALVLLALSLFLNSAGRSATQAQEASKPTRLVWEYKVVRVNEEELNRLGAEGWEVVAAYGDVKGQSAGMRAINTIERTILKRPKAN